MGRRISRTRSRLLFYVLWTAAKSGSWQLWGVCGKSLIVSFSFTRGRSMSPLAFDLPFFSKLLGPTMIIFVNVIVVVVVSAIAVATFVVVVTVVCIVVVFG